MLRVWSQIAVCVSHFSRIKRKGKITICLIKPNCAEFKHTNILEACLAPC